MESVCLGPKVIPLSGAHCNIFKMYYFTKQGSENNDKLIGNSRANKFNGSRGDDYLEGRNGQDYYVMQKGDGDDTINNYAEDQQTDVLFLDANKDEISVEEGEMSFSEHLTIRGEDKLYSS